MDVTTQGLVSLGTVTAPLMHLYLFEITAVLYTMTLFSRFTCVQRVGGTVKFILQSVSMFFSLCLSDSNSEASLHTQLTPISGSEYASLVAIYLFLSSLCNVLLPDCCHCM